MGGEVRLLHGCAGGGFLVPGLPAVRAYPRHLKGPFPYPPVTKKPKVQDSNPLSQPACESIDLAKIVAFESYRNAPERLDNFMDKYVYAANPKFPESVTDACNEYARKIEALGKRLMEVFALALGFDPVKELKEHANEPWYYYRLINYKGGQKPPNPAMMPAHTDFGWLTILNQNFSEVTSLEMQDSETKAWRPIPAKKGALSSTSGT